jgi:hypothetical protein
VPRENWQYSPAGQAEPPRLHLQGVPGQRDSIPSRTTRSHDLDPRSDHDCLTPCRPGKRPLETSDPWPLVETRKWAVEAGVSHL